jgi:DNA-binding transcriptional LysR family regulator
MARLRRLPVHVAPSLPVAIRWIHWQSNGGPSRSLRRSCPNGASLPLAEGHILISPLGRPAGVVDQALSRLKRTRRVMVTLPHFLAAPAVISNTDYVMTIARRIALQLSQIYHLRVFPPPVRLNGFDMVMAWHPRSEAEAGVIWLKQKLRRAASELCS